MKWKICWLLVALPLVLAFSLEPRQPGPLVLVGGGGTPTVAVEKAMDLAGGERAKIVIVPWASGREGRGDSSVEMYRELGALDVVNAEALSASAAKLAFEEADLIWMPGGSQVRLMRELGERELVDVLRQAHARGCVVGGTSAGTAVATDPMLAGSPEVEGVRSGVAKLDTGLGLWEGALVDQHFVERQRESRLLSAVLDDPSRMGFGISESTAAIVQGSRLTVLGESVVVVYDARKARVEKSLGKGECAGVTGVTLSVLRAGMSLELRK